MEHQRKGKGLAPGQGKIEHTEWNKVHEGIKEQVVQDREMAQQCTRYGRKNNNWANLRKFIQVCTIGTQLRKHLHQRPRNASSEQWKAGHRIPSRRPTTSTVTRKKSAEGIPPVNQIEKPLAWDFSDMGFT